MIEKIAKMIAEVESLQAGSLEEIEALRIKYLSKKGEITALMADFRNVPAEEKKTAAKKKASPAKKTETKKSESSGKKAAPKKKAQAKKKSEEQ